MAHVQAVLLTALLGCSILAGAGDAFKQIRWQSHAWCVFGIGNEKSRAQLYFVITAYASGT